MPSSLVGPLTILAWLFIGLIVLGIVFTIVWVVIAVLILGKDRS